MIRTFVRHPVLVNLLMFGVIGFGILYYRANVKEQMPEVRIHAAWIAAHYPGTSARDMEKLITRPLEKQVKTVEGIHHFTSRTTEGRVFIWIEFRQTIPDITKAVLDVQNAVNRVEDYPADARKPVVSQAKVRFPAMIVTLIGGGLPEGVVRQAGRKLKERLERLTDCGEVWTSGIRERQVEVELKPSRLSAHGVTINHVVRALRTRKRDVPAGSIAFGRREYSLRVKAELRSLDDIRKLVVLPDPTGKHVRIEDVARVRVAFKEALTSSQVNGQRGVVLTVMKEYGGDILRLSRNVRREVARMRPQLPAGMKIKILGDGARVVKSSLNTLYSNGAIGMALVLVALWLFMGMRNALMASLGLPVALLGATAIMYVLGVTVSMPALFALILCVGIVVDDAIVIIENIYRHLEQGAPALRAAIDGTHEVMWPVISSVLTTCAAFLPLLLMTGVMGKFFAIIPKVVVAALAVSLLEALIILPSHMADFGRVSRRMRQGAGDDSTRLVRFARRAVSAYRRVLTRVVRWPVLVTLGAIALCVVMVGAAFATKDVVLIADEDVQVFDVRIKMPRGARLSETMATLQAIQRRLIARLPKSEYEGIVAQAGWSRTRLFPVRGKHLGMVTVFLVRTNERERRGKTILADARRQLRDIVGPLKLELAPVVFGPPKGMPVAVRISGEKFPKLRRVADRIKALLRDIPGLTAVHDDFDLGKRELRLRVDTARAALHGLSHAEIGRFVRAAYDGLPVTKYRHRDEELDVLVRYDPAVRNDPTRLATIKVGTPSGKRVALGDVTSIEQGRSIAVIRHRNRKRSIKVAANVSGEMNSSRANLLLRRKLAAIVAANPDLTFDLGGEWEKTAESLGSLVRAGLLALALMFTILAAQFRSVSQVFVVLLAIPLSLIGVVTGFFVSGEPVGMVALIGVVGLAGIAVNDATVLLDFINKRRAAGMARDEAVIEACTLRIRPVLLTSVTTVAGLVPLALGWGGTAESLKPMALAIVWGLSFCTVLTLLVVPCMYITLTRLANRLFPQSLRRWLFNDHDEPTQQG